eukprot:2758359-Pyramimonas_sp.AAC.1
MSLLGEHRTWRSARFEAVEVADVSDSGGRRYQSRWGTRYGGRRDTAVIAVNRGYKPRGKTR